MPEWLANANWILDVILGIVLLVLLIVGYKCGFLKAVIKLASFFGGFVVAILFTEPLTAKVIDWKVFSDLSDKIETNILTNLETTSAYQEYMTTEGTVNTDAIINKLGIPDFLYDFFKTTLDSVTESANIKVAISAISDGITKAVATVVVFLFLLIFTGIAFAIVKLVVKILRDKFTLIKIADGILGVVLYGALGMLAIYVFMLVVSLVMQSTTNGFTEFMVQQLHVDDDKFGLAKWFYQNNYLGNFVSLFF